MPRSVVRPYLIARDEEGAFRITTRTTRFNSQGYRLVVSTLLDGTFPTLSTARAHVRREFQAQATDIATQ